MTTNTSPRPHRKRASTVRVAALLLLGAAGAGSCVFLQCVRGSASEAPAPPKAESVAIPPVKVTVETVRAQQFEHVVRVTGTVKSDEVVQLSAKATGLVQHVFAKEGDRVREGQLLVLIDDRELRAQRDKAEAAVQSAEARLKQAETSRGIKNAAVMSDYRRAQQALATARTRLSQAHALARISATEVESGVDGARAQLQAARERLKVVQDGARRQEKATAELTVARVQAQANKLKGNLERREQLLRRGYIAPEDVENVRRDYEVALAELDSAKQQLDLVSEGSRSEEIRVAEEQVRQAEASLRTAEANRARRGISDEDVDAAEAQVRQAEATLDSSRAALAQSQWNDDEIATARAAVAQARAEVRYYEQLIAQTRIYSPVSAVVTERQIHVGETVSQSRTELMTLVATDTPYFEATAPESVLPYLRPGGSATVTLDALPGKTLAGAIREIIPVAEGSNRSVRLRISLRRPAAAGVPADAVVGGFARATVRGASQQPVLTVPVSAVISDEGARSVIVYQDGKADTRVVRVGATNGRRVEILSGLHAGETLIVTGAATLSDGQSVALDAR